MKLPPTVYESACPSCGCYSGVSLADSGYFWLADQRWMCPYCERTHSTEQIQNKARKKNDEQQAKSRPPCQP